MSQPGFRALIKSVALPEQEAALLKRETWNYAVLIEALAIENGFEANQEETEDRMKRFSGRNSIRLALPQAEHETKPQTLL